MMCGRTGTTVAAHANRVSLGKGTGIKAPDYYTAWLCYQCHDMADGRRGCPDPGDRHAFWEQAFIRTVARWFELGIVCVK